VVCHDCVFLKIVSRKDHSMEWSFLETFETLSVAVFFSFFQLFWGSSHSKTHFFVYGCGDLFVLYFEEK